MESNESNESNEWCERVWDDALKNKPCKCNNDKNWVQIAVDNGPIYCVKRGTQVV